MGRYNFRAIEPKWQEYWEKHKTFKATRDPGKPKYYALDMFPYPSGAGMHVGHPEGYTATDIVCRYKRMRGFNVLHPMGWDAYGLPAEQYAIQTGTHPKITTEKNIANFKRQIRALGFSYDWDREVNTTDPKYFKWTQWIFKQLFEHWYDPKKQKARPISELPLPAKIQGDPQKERRYRDGKRLAYLDEVPVWWCPALGTVLANEEVVDGRSERGHHPCERRPLKQWMLRITAYAHRLEKDLEGLDWSESIKTMQRNWIGRSQGASVRFELEGGTDIIEVFTTRPDTLFGATYMVLAPEHPLVEKITAAEQRSAVKDYRAAANAKSELERGMDKEKTGVFTGCYVKNPVNGERIPVWISDYVMMGYGTGAIMAVPAHDERDYAFATKFDLPIVEVISGGDIGKEAWTGNGTLVNSSNEGLPGFEQTSLSLNGLDVPAAKKKIIAWLEENELGKGTIQYKLRDWLFSRQRYWGEPFPIVHTSEGCEVVPDEELPVLPPDLSDFKPTGTFEPPLSKDEQWKTYSGNGMKGVREVQGIREVNTMPQWAGSCWYYLRYLDPNNEKEPVSREDESYWMPVDLYIGGAEHAVLHLLYSRFWHKFLYDIGKVSHPEPFQKLVNQGMILGEVEYTALKIGGEFVSFRETPEGEHVKLPEDRVEKKGEGFVLKGTDVRVEAKAHKMSKSRGNVVNPDDIIHQFGADSMRLYEMFMGPLERMKPWNTAGLEGQSRFLSKVWRTVVGEEESPRAMDEGPVPEVLKRVMHRSIKKVTEDLEGLQFNTAISQLMIFINEMAKEKNVYREPCETLIKLLAPLAPHVAEEIWSLLGHKETLAYQPWPEYDPRWVMEDQVTLVFQTNGKVRARAEVAKGLDKDQAVELAKSHENMKRHLEGADVVKVIHVPDKLVNVVVKPGKK